MPVTAQILHMDIKHQLTGLRIQTKITQQNENPYQRKLRIKQKWYINFQFKLMQRNFFDTKEYDVHIHLNMMTPLRFSIWISIINSHV